MNIISVKLRGGGRERWVEGTVFEPESPRLCTLDGVPIEAPLGGTLVFMGNDDRPGVIGAVGSALGRHGVNIASFALGRDERGAVSVLGVDEADTPRAQRRRGAQARSRSRGGWSGCVT